MATLASTIVSIEEVGGEIVRFGESASQPISDMTQPLTEEMIERMAKQRERHLCIFF